MSHFRPYPKYKNSSISWLKVIPEGWCVVTLKYIAFLKSGESITAEAIENSGDFPVYGGNGLRGFCDRFTHEGLFPLIGRQGALCGNINYANGRFWASEHAVVVSPKSGITTKWLGELLRAMNLNQYSVSAAQPGLSVEVVSNLRVPLPPQRDQNAIAAFLDRETARIDLLITKKTRFIELLKEKRQAVITRAVTKGLDDSLPMKDSGVKWLGKVPAHWRVRRMASIFREAIRTGDPALPILSISIHDGITDNEIAPEDRDRRVLQIEDRTKYKRVAPNDLAYNMMRAWQGAFGAVVVDGLVSPAYVVAEPTSEFRTAFIENLLRTPTAIEEMRRFSRGIADFRMRLYWDYFRDLRVCLPPQAEQDKILDMITRETSRIDRLAEKTERSIDLLKEHRAALITAAVTGKIDVREAA